MFAKSLTESQYLLNAGSDRRDAFGFRDSIHQEPPQGNGTCSIFGPFGRNDQSRQGPHKRLNAQARAFAG